MKLATVGVLLGASLREWVALSGMDSARSSWCFKTYSKAQMVSLLVRLRKGDSYYYVRVLMQVK